MSLLPWHLFQPENRPRSTFLNWSGCGWCFFLIHLSATDKSKHVLPNTVPSCLSNTHKSSLSHPCPAAARPSSHFVIHSSFSWKNSSLAGRFHSPPRKKNPLVPQTASVLIYNMEAYTVPWPVSYFPLHSDSTRSQEKKRSVLKYIPQQSGAGTNLHIFQEDVYSGSWKYLHWTMEGRHEGWRRGWKRLLMTMQ